MKFEIGALLEGMVEFGAKTRFVMENDNPEEAVATLDRFDTHLR